MAPTPRRDLAMALTRRGAGVLEPIEQTLPTPGPRQVLLRVQACGVCRTDLHIVDAEIETPQLPIVPGHEVVGEVAATGASSRWAIGARVGVPWLHSTCGHCGYCRHGRENLCATARFTGLHRDGGYARWMLADDEACIALPESIRDEQAAPLLCAGLIGWRALAMAGDAQTLALYGFGAAGHLIAQVALQQGRRVYAFTRPGDAAAQDLARSLGVHWAGGADESPPTAVDAALLFAPVGSLVPLALQHSQPGATIVCAGIHMSDIPSFAYRLLWGERCLRSVANLTRRDGETFFAWVAQHALHSTVESFALADANLALQRLRSGELTGAAVLDCR